MTHRIRRLTWQVRGGRGLAPLQLRRQLREQWSELLLPALTASFDEVAGPDVWIHIPRIEVRLRVRSPKELGSTLPEQVRRDVLQRLREATQRGPGSEAEALTTRSRAENALEALLHYLETGSLPWMLADLPRAEVAELLAGAAPAAIPRSAGRAREGRATPYLFRLLDLCSDEQAIQVARALMIRDADPEARAVLERAVAQTLRRSEAPRRERLLLLAVLLSELARAASLPTRAALEAALAAAAAGEPAALAHWAAALWTESQPPPLPLGERLGKESIGSTGGARPALTPPLTPKGPKGRGGQRGDEEIGKHPLGAALLPAAPLDHRGMAASRTTSFPPAQRCAPVPGTPVRFAGLVLIHPYLPRFLKHCGVVDGSKLLEEMLPRAAALLHLLGGGAQAPREYELGIIKVLLGLGPQDELLVSDGLLSERDHREAETLLRAVVGHWKVLKQTSVAGLQAAFLSRSGLLRPQQAHWLLQVEPQSFDVLLNHLPWGIGIVKLPWMLRPVHTEWTISL